MISAPLILALSISGAPFSSSSEAAAAIAAGTETEVATKHLLRKGRKGLWAIDALQKKQWGAARGRLLDAAGRFRTPEAEYVLKKAIKSGNAEVRAGAIRGLGHFKDRRFKKYFLENAVSKHAVIQDAVLAAMIETGPRLVEEAKALTGSKREGARAIGMAYLVKYGRPGESTDTLKTALADPSPRVRASAAKLVGEKRVVSLAPSLEPMLRAEPAVALAALESLITMWSRSTPKTLMRVIGDPKAADAVWQRAGEAMVARNDTGAYVALARAIRKAPASRRQALEQMVLRDVTAPRIAAVVSLLSAGSDVAPVARRLLREIGEPAEDAAIASLANADARLEEAIVTFLMAQPRPRIARKLLAGAKTGSPENRAAAIGLIAKMVDGSVEAELIELSQDESPIVRVAALRALAGLNSTNVEKALVAAAKDAQPRIRIVAVQSLGRVPTPGRRAAIRGALDDEDRDVRLAAIDQLSPVPDRATLRVLRARLDRVTQIEREAIVRSISKSKLPESSQMLVDLVTHRDPDIRKAALHVVNAQ